MFSQKKKYFKHKADGVQKMIWDLEFKREKTMMIREEVRREYDGTLAKINIHITKIEGQLKDPKKKCEIHNPEEGKERVLRAAGKCVCEYIENHIPTDEIDRLYDQVEILTRDSERYKAQMKQMDVDVQGSPKNSEFPDGADGINQQLDSLRELQGMIKQYISKI